MKVTAERTIPKRQEIYTVCLKCDVCGRLSEDATRWNVREGNETFVKHWLNDPETDVFKCLELQICPSCFHTVLIPLIKTFGVRNNFEYEEL